MKHPHPARHATRPQAGSQVADGLRRFSTAAVLFHQTLAERLGLGATDLQCLHLLLERETATASELAALTGLTSGALTGVVARLEAAGFIERTADPRDGRRQTLQARAVRLDELDAAFAPLHQELHRMLAAQSAAERRSLVAFLTEMTTLLYRHLALLRAQRTAAPLRKTMSRAPGRRR